MKQRACAHPNIKTISTDKKNNLRRRVCVDCDYETTTIEMALSQFYKYKRAYDAAKK